MLTYLCNRLHLIKRCLCCFLVIHLYSNNLSSLTTFSSLIMSEFLPSCFSCSNKFNLLHNSSELDGENIVEIPDAMKAGGFNNFIIDLSLSLFCPCCLILKFISFPNSCISFRSCGLEFLAMKSQIVIVSKRSPSNLKDLLLSLKVNMFSSKLTDIPPFIKKSSLTLRIITNSHRFFSVTN